MGATGLTGALEVLHPLLLTVIGLKASCASLPMGSVQAHGRA